MGAWMGGGEGPGRGGCGNQTERELRSSITLGFPWGRLPSPSCPNSRADTVWWLGSGMVIHDSWTTTGPGENGLPDRYEFCRDWAASSRPAVVRREGGCEKTIRDRDAVRRDPSDWVGVMVGDQHVE